MKKYILLICMITIGLIFSSCSPDYQTKFTKYHLDVASRFLADTYFDKPGGTKEIPVSTNVKETNWTATSNAFWCVVTHTKEKITISADENTLGKRRHARVTIKYGHVEYNISIVQEGEDRVVNTDETDDSNTSSDNTESETTTSNN